MKDREKRIILILTIVTIIFVTLGGTFAYFRWATSDEQNTNVTFTVTSNFSCSGDGGGTISSNEIRLEPTECTNTENVIRREVNLSTTSRLDNTNIYFNLWLDVINIGSGLTNSENLKYTISTTDSCTENIVNRGDFKDITDNGRVNLLEERTFVGATTQKFYLYIWLDAAEESSSTMNQSFTLEYGGSCTDSKSANSPSVPSLDAGLIPVILSDDATNGYKVTATTSDDPNWYNYDEKEWANAVLVKETGVKTRTANKVAGTEIDTNNILAYFVWIPRYAYQIWDDDATDTASSPQPINIMWESGDAAYTEGTQVDEYRTHPAFWWDENGNRDIDSGETISGIWVGKFETTQGTSSNVGTSNPTILPGISPWLNQTVSEEFTTAMKFSGGTMTDNITSYAGSPITYGLTSSTNAHMMKNSEWGAVAYLSHSEYGIGEEIRINNYYNSGMMTGCGAVTAEDLSQSITCSNAYSSGISEYPQSTTGNISGIFDMSGGAWEYVMGNYGNKNGSSRFAASWFTELSNQKYYDLYPSDIFTGNYLSNITFCTIETCGGHALFETKSWYGDYAFFMAPGDGDYWFRRGGDYSNGSGAGAWHFFYFDGSAYSSYGFRVVLSR